MLAKILWDVKSAVIMLNRGTIPSKAFIVVGDVVGVVHS